MNSKRMWSASGYRDAGYAVHGFQMRGGYVQVVVLRWTGGTGMNANAGVDAGTAIARYDVQDDRAGGERADLESRAKQRGISLEVILLLIQCEDGLRYI